jgi:predicted regulator of amino acid metabolism with ACT domain
MTPTDTPTPPAQVSRDEVVQALREAIDQFADGKYSRSILTEMWSLHNHIRPGQTYCVLDGEIEPTDEICEAVGFRRRVVYERIEP